MNESISSMRKSKVSPIFDDTKTNALLSDKKFFKHPWYLLSIWLILPFIHWYLEFFRGRFNNYKVFRQVYHHLLEKKNLYDLYPTEYYDCYHYGPIYWYIIAPFAVLPDVIGTLLWSIFNVCVLFIALWKLPFQKENRILIILLCTVEMANGMWSNQFNSIAAAMIVLCFVLVENKKDFWAAFFIMLGTFIKLYGIIGLAFFLFSKNKKQFFLGCVIWTVVLFLLPMLVSSPQYILQTYQDWYLSVTDKNDWNVYLDSSQDASIMGIVRRVLQDVTIPNLPFIIGGTVLYLLPFLRFSQFKYLNFRLLILSSSLMFVILFSSSSEHPTYIYPMIGTAIWFVLQGKNRTSFWNMALLLFVILFAGLGPTDAFGKPLRTFMINYSLKALPYTIVWILVIKDLLLANFQTSADDGITQKEIQKI